MRSAQRQTIQGGLRVVGGAGELEWGRQRCMCVNLEGNPDDGLCLV